MKRLLTLAAAAVFAAAAVSATAEDMLQIKGSDTLINVAQKLAEVYQQNNPGTMVAVTGGGSGTGIAALINGTCAVANASRLMKAKEIADAQSKGIDPKQIVVAIDGLSIVVNPSNPIDQLTVEEVGRLFRGEVKNWKELGGSDAPVTLYGRQSNSGTYDFMIEHVLKGEYSPKMNQMNGNAQIIEALKQDASGIGYCGVGYVKNEPSVKVLKIAAKSGGYYATPLDDNEVESGKYPISRPLNQYIDGKKLTPEIKAFIAFELSEEGQKIVVEEGFFAIPDEYKKFNEKMLG